MSIPIVAIVGRPNVGKSSLFNKIMGKRLAIVDDMAGVTRDRIYGESEWCGFKFKLIDTGGLEIKTTKVKLLQQVQEQTNFSISIADVIIFVVDLTSGVLSADFEIAKLLRGKKKKVITCVNKCDSIGVNLPTGFYEFYGLFQEKIFPISSIHGHGVGDMLDCLVSDLKKDAEDNFDEDEDIVKIAIVGRPNVGKSSLVNRLVGKERVIVSSAAGTTRDSVDVLIGINKRKYMLIDTAGIRKKSKIFESVEKYSVIRSYMAVDRASVCIVLIDAVDGFVEQDSKIAGYVHDSGKSCIIAVNKWDLVEKDSHTIAKFNDRLKENLSFMGYAPYIYISAKTGQRLGDLLTLAENVDGENKKRLPTGLLNEAISFAVSKVQPPSDKGKNLKIYYITQIAVSPPTFVLFVNKKELVHFSYKRFLENQLRESFGFVGTPIKLIVRERNK